MLKDYQKRILELLEQLELEMAGLYKLFAKKFPARADLWTELVKEENEHAERIKRLHSLADEEKLVFDEKMTKTYTVQLFIDNIKKLSAEADKITLMKALVMSRDFEESIMEKRIYGYFISDDSEVKTLINQIKEETGNHSAKIKKVLAEEKNK